MTSGVPAMVDTDYAVTTAGSAFSISESAVVGDTIKRSYHRDGHNRPSLTISDYGEVVTGSGAVKRTLAATNLQRRNHDGYRRRSGHQCHRSATDGDRT